MGLAVMIVGLVLFLGTHTISTRRDLRARLIVSWGASGYKIAYSIASAIGLVLIIYGFAGYRAAGMIPVWTPPVSLRHLAIAAMLPASILFAAAYLRGYIQAKLKHPMLAGLKLWALAHLLANGDLGSIVLFGSFLAWAVYDRISFKTRTDDVLGSVLPSRPGLNDALAVGAGAIVFLAIAFVFHPVVIGVPVFGV